MGLLSSMRASAVAAVTIIFSCAAAAQTTLNVSSWVPPNHIVTVDVMMAFCKDVERDTSGRIRCNLLPKPVVAPPQTFDAVRDGLADISYVVHGYTPGRFPLSEVAELPFLGNTAEASSVAYQRIYDRHLKKFDEHKGVHTLAVFTHGPGSIFNTRRPIASLKDIEGLKIRVGGGIVNEVARVLGGVPLQRPVPENYELLSQGIADATFVPKEAPLSFKLIPIIKHGTYVPGGFYNVSMMVIMNPARYASLSPADRAVVDKHSGEVLARRGGKAFDSQDAKSHAAMMEAKIPIVTADAAFIADIKAKTGGIEKDWIARVKAKGADGAALLSELRKEIAAYKP